MFTCLCLYNHSKSLLKIPKLFAVTYRTRHIKKYLTKRSYVWTLNHCLFITIILALRDLHCQEFLIITSLLVKTPPQMNLLLAPQCPYLISL